jgi:hypothetical protein
MPSSIERNLRRELLILDTGPLRELVLYHAVHHLRFESLKSKLRFILNAESYRRCGEFIGSFRRKTNSASVVCEINHWIRATERTGQWKLWNRVYDEFKNMGMDEDVVKLLDMDKSLVARLGPVDVSLLEIAKRHSSLSPIILTIDSELYADCVRAGLHAQHIRDLARIE